MPPSRCPTTPTGRWRRRWPCTARSTTLNQAWEGTEREEFLLGIGLSTGKAAAALLGSEERLEYTLVGDTVNLAQRLQEMARPGGQTILSEATWEGLTERPTRHRQPARARQGPGHPRHHLSDRTRDLEPAMTTIETAPTGAPLATDVVLDVRGVRRTFEAENAPVRALRGTDFQMRRGEFVAIMGPSGCGKSTLLNLIAGLDQADEGTIVLADEEVTGKTEDELARMRRKHIGIVFQFFNLLEGMTVLENVALPAMVAGLKRKPAETRGRDLLDLLGLADKAKAAPGSLSGGQRQRLAIARALANEPTLLLADEPTGALDSEGGHEVIELFRRLHQGGQTILMVTHDDDVAAAGQRIARMKDGKVVDAGDGSPTSRAEASSRDHRADLRRSPDRRHRRQRAPAAGAGRRARGGSPSPAASLTESDLVAGSWVRAAIVAAWAIAAAVLAARGYERLGLVAAAASIAGGACAATASSADLATVHVVAASLDPRGRAPPRAGHPARAHRRSDPPERGDHRLRHRPPRRRRARRRRPRAGRARGGGRRGRRAPARPPAAHQTYLGATGVTRQRLQLVGCAVAIIVEVALVVAALRLLVDWPAHAAEVAAGATILVPLALAAGTSPRISRQVDRVLVHTVSATGLTAVVVLVYLVIVIGLGRTPADTERTLLVLSMLAAAVAALAYVPARERLAETANRLVYGERHPPDEVLRTWGSRLSRSIPMDELLLQLAESLRKVLVLRRAEIWTGTPGRLELAVSVPDREAPPLVLGAEEQPVVTRAGVTGNAWLEVWLPALLEGRTNAQLRVAPGLALGRAARASS